MSSGTLTFNTHRQITRRRDRGPVLPSDSQHPLVRLERDLKHSGRANGDLKQLFDGEEVQETLLTSQLSPKSSDSEDEWYSTLCLLLTTRSGRYLLTIDKNFGLPGHVADTFCLERILNKTSLSDIVQAFRDDRFGRNLDLAPYKSLYGREPRTSTPGSPESQQDSDSQYGSD